VEFGDIGMILEVLMCLLPLIVPAVTAIFVFCDKHIYRTRYFKYEQYKQLKDLRTVHKRQYQMKEYGFEIVEYRDWVEEYFKPKYKEDKTAYKGELPSTGHYE
jgi:hypothetical protein